MTDLEFQILDWNHYHEKNDDDDEEYFVGRLFGKTIDNQSICLHIKNFSPYFYIELDKTWNIGLIENIIINIKKNISSKEYVNGLIEYKIIKKYKFYGFTNFEEFNFLQLFFTNYNSFKAYEKVLNYPLYIPLLFKKIKLTIYESNIYPLLRVMHIRELDAVGWVRIEKGKYTIKTEEDTSCMINATCKWTNLKRMENNKIQKFIIAAYDIECTSEDGSFPNPERDGDKIIQIGITVSRYGEEECYSKYIITLGKCDDIKNVNVKWYNTEEEVLLSFSELIREIDPDIITGYNIFGFDYNYLNKRSEKLGISIKFSQLSRIKGEISKFVIQKLSSNALGENILKYYEMTGRISIDLMKIIQKDYKLSSYKLDDVSSYFIKENVINFINTNDKTIIKTNKTNDIQIEQYICIIYDDGITENKHMNGKKFKIIEINNDSLLVDGIIEIKDIIDKGYKIYWCQVKDDIKPSEIFKLQKGTSQDRAIIAKYCIQDCTLCNKLINKLHILPNNIGMANVCNVPLSYLFLRGQGIKIFSLVAKKCRMKNHLIPVIKKKYKNNEQNNIQKTIKYIEKYSNNKYLNQEEEEEYIGYEGATVFEPKIGVHFEPVTVLDFASLYPNAMILRNLSHEMFINNNNYDNLPGYRYHSIEYKNNDNTTTLCKFAEKEDNTKGIIPEILMDLLTARKKYKKLVENTKNDPFLKYIYDGLQLAYKLTANSLYGQTGAPTSQIYMKEIAASTTATGREMLHFSKYFIENIYNKLIKTCLNESKINFKKIMDTQYEYYPNDIILTKSNGLDKIDNTIIHVHIDNKTKISDNNFIRNYIGYNINNNVFMNIEYKNNEQLYEKFFNTLNNIGYIKRTTFFNAFKKLLLCKSSIKKFMNNYKEILDIMDINNEILNTMINNEQIILNIDDINKIINNMGFLNKNELFEKFYDTFNQLFNEFEINPEVIYGDTDSVFFISHIKNKLSNEILKDKKALELSIILGIWGSIMISTLMPSPMSQEYEKVLYPFAILSKKRYVGNLYEKDPNKFYQKSMGIVLKRRDNAPIVKIICGGIIDYILNKRSIEGAINFTKNTLKNIITDKYSLDKFIITKTLRGTYSGKLKKNKTENGILIKAGTEGKWFWNEVNCSIGHVTLCQRMAKRDIGNTPVPNDRISYVFFETNTKSKLQGEHIEHPDYLLNNNLKIDYQFYITNQIAKPAIQFLELIMNKPDKLFNNFIIREENRKKGVKPIMSYFDTTDKSSFDDFIENINNNF